MPKRSETGSHTVAGGYMRSDAQEIEFVELAWETEATKSKPAIKVQMTEFHQLVDDVESLQPKFLQLQKVFESRTRYTKAWEDANPAPLAIWAKHQAELAKRERRAGMGG